MARSWWAGWRAAGVSDAEAARQERAIADLKGGRLPGSALTRLHDDLAFAGNVSSAEFLALRGIGYEVAGQVFGSSSYLISRSAQNLTGYSVHPGGRFGSTGSAWASTSPTSAGARNQNSFYSDPLAVAPRLLAGYHDGANTARATALRRLRAECLELDADGVLGVRVVSPSKGSSGDAADSGRLSQQGLYEFTVVGTAVRRATPLPGPPFTTMLSAIEVATLARAGWRPLEMLYEHQRYGGHGGYVGIGGGGRFNPLTYATGEIAAASTVATFAGSETRRRLATGLGAGAGLLLHSYRLETDVEACRLVGGQTDLLVDVEAIATSIVALKPLTVRREAPAIDVTPVVRLT